MLQNMPRENKDRLPTSPTGVEKWSEYEVQDPALPRLSPGGGGGPADA